MLDNGFTRRSPSSARVDITQPMIYSADEACDVGAEHGLAMLTEHGPATAQAPRAATENLRLVFAPDPASMGVVASAEASI
jgi:hypothetical protein